MSLLQNTLNETLEALPANAIAELSALLDPAWIEQALQATGKASMRRRKLPAEALSKALQLGVLLEVHCEQDH